MDDNGGTDRGPRDWVQRLIARTNRNRHDERANSRAARLARFTRVVEKIDQEIDADDDPLQQAIKNSIAKLPSARALKSTEPPKLRNLRLDEDKLADPSFPWRGSAAFDVVLWRRGVRPEAEEKVHFRYSPKAHKIKIERPDDMENWAVIEAELAKALRGLLRAAPLSGPVEKIYK